MFGKFTATVVLLTIAVTAQASVTTHKIRLSYVAGGVKIVDTWSSPSAINDYYYDVYPLTGGSYSPGHISFAPALSGVVTLGVFPGISFPSGSGGTVRVQAFGPACCSANDGQVVPGSFSSIDDNDPALFAGTIAKVQLYLSSLIVRYGVPSIVVMLSLVGLYFVWRIARRAMATG